MRYGFIKKMLCAGALTAVVVAMAMPAAFAACDPEQYFAAADYDHKTPLAKPDPSFADDLRKARAGDHLAQRSVAISYETGYLVSQCQEQAVYWYSKAAKGGDKEAVKWMADYDAVERLAAGPNCIGSNCNSGTEAGPQLITLSARGPNGHFFTTLTINGKTVEAVIDTGASTVVVSLSAAASMGLLSEGLTRIRTGTANGVANAYARTVPQLSVGSITLNNVVVVIAPNTTANLIGMSALRQLKVSVGNGVMTLAR